MKKITLKGIYILALVGAAIGFMLCLFSGEFKMSTILITTGGTLIIGLFEEGDETGNVSSPATNSAIYNTDIATGKLITELQKLNKK